MKLQIKVSFIIISRLVQNLSVLSIKENYKQIKKNNKKKKKKKQQGTDE